MDLRVQRVSVSNPALHMSWIGSVAKWRLQGYSRTQNLDYLQLKSDPKHLARFHIVWFIKVMQECAASAASFRPWFAVTGIKFIHSIHWKRCEEEKHLLSLHFLQLFLLQKTSSYPLPWESASRASAHFTSSVLKMSSKTTGCILSIIIFNCKNEKPTVAASVYDLSSFNLLNRGSAKEIATFSSREVIQRTQVGQKLCIKYRIFSLHASKVLILCKEWKTGDGLYLPQSCKYTKSRRSRDYNGSLPSTSRFCLSCQSHGSCKYDFVGRKFVFSVVHLFFVASFGSSLSSLTFFLQHYNMETNSCRLQRTQIWTWQAWLIFSPSIRNQNQQILSWR